MDTIFLSWLITGNPLTGLKIGFSEMATKMILYYAHERAWFRIKLPDSQKRHLIKTITWRVVGTIDTILLSWFISGNPLTGLKIGFAEVLTKMILYYFHERLWYRINFGLDKRNRAKKWKRT
ncbi:putative membrane protein [Saonia flava]|uniref:Putative membrane protein n=1 Tax=Saonia flava TaxID=523696 RepID=A0A846R0P3_9FLAO|nr:putative membrane protein [Saonia flava]